MWHISSSLVVGKSYSLSCWVKNESGQTEEAIVNFYCGTESRSVTQFLADGSDWTQIKIENVVCTGNTQLFVELGTFNFGGGFYFDEIIVEEGTTVGTYFDGDSTGAEWSGTPHNSTSFLTAIEQSWNEIGGVPTFENAIARAVAIPTPTLGMYTHLEDGTPGTQFWNGSAWRSPSGLTLIRQQAVSPGVITAVLSNVFSADYHDYKIIYSGGVSTGVNYIQVRLGVNGLVSAANYKTAFAAVNYSTGAVTGTGTVNSSSWEYAGRRNTNFADLSIEIREPFLARRTRLSGAFSLDGTSSATVGGVHELANSYNDLSISDNSLAGGTISVYGYRKD